MNLQEEVDLKIDLLIVLNGIEMPVMRKVLAMVLIF